MLSINKVSYKYKDSLEVLKDLSFSVGAGEFIGIVGPNGSGKTTLLRLLAGYFQPTKGTILLNDKSIFAYTKIKRSQQIAVVPQYHAVNQFYTVYDLVQLGRNPYHSFFKRFSKQDAEIIENKLTELEMLEFSGRQLKSLSGGELQRALIVRALVQDTPIIIMDEPTNHLDIHHQIEVLNLMKNYQKNGKTIISVFHDLNFAAKYSNKILVLDREIKAFGPPAEVLNEQIIQDIFHTDAFFVNKDLRVVLK